MVISRTLEDKEMIGEEMIEADIKEVIEVVIEVADLEEVTEVEEEEAEVKEDLLEVEEIMTIGINMIRAIIIIKTENKMTMDLIIREEETSLEGREDTEEEEMIEEDLIIIKIAMAVGETILGKTIIKASNPLKITKVVGKTALIILRNKTIMKMDVKTKRSKIPTRITIMIGTHLNLIIRIKISAAIITIMKVDGEITILETISIMIGITRINMILKLKLMNKDKIMLIDLLEIKTTSLKTILGETITQIIISLIKDGVIGVQEKVTDHLSDITISVPKDLEMIIRIINNKVPENWLEKMKMIGTVILVLE